MFSPRTFRNADTGRTVRNGGCDVNGFVPFFILVLVCGGCQIGGIQKNETPGAVFFFRAGAGWFSSSSVNRHTRLVSCGRGLATDKGVSSLLEAADACSCFARHAR